MRKIFIIFAALAVFLLPLSVSGATADEYTVTFYCSACNSPRGTNVVALDGSIAQIGTCASNDFPLGSFIYIEGVGYFYVNDRMGRSGVIDVYRGEYEVCECIGKFRTRAAQVS